MRNLETLIALSWHWFKSAIRYMCLWNLMFLVSCKLAFSLLTPDCQNWKKYSICDFCFPFRRKIPAICIICSLPYLGISFVYFCKKECRRSNFGQFAGLPDRGHFLTNLQTFGYRLLKSTKLGIGQNLQNSLSKQLSGFFGIQDPIWKHFKCFFVNSSDFLQYFITENYNPWITISFFSFFR